MSKTLDSASAHFAASAVVSAPAPSRSEVTKEQNTSHNNINGVVQPSGDDFLKLVISCRVENVKLAYFLFSKCISVRCSSSSSYSFKYYF